MCPILKKFYSQISSISWSETNLASSSGIQDKLVYRNVNIILFDIRKKSLAARIYCICKFNVAVYMYRIQPNYCTVRLDF